MSNISRLNRLFWLFWFFTTFFTAIAAGNMFSHSILLGRFFSWYVQSNNLELLRLTYTAFVEASRPHPNAFYYIPFYLSFVSGLVWTILALLLKRDRLIAITAGISTFWVGSIYLLTNFYNAEKTVLSGVADELTARFFLSANVPIHVVFTMIYAFSLALLLYTAVKGYLAQDGA